MIEYNESYRATYSPEDDKIRLYTGRVSREDYEFLRKNKFISTPKQSCDFVAHWSCNVEDIALAMCGTIEDEDQSLEDRAADRAERFGGYRDKRLAESLGHIYGYESRPEIHGYQSAKKAESAANAHNRIGDRAVTQWDKAEYWVSRTEGVIRNALYLSSPSVRLGRIKTIESDMRREEKFIRERNHTIDTLNKALLKYGDSPDDLSKCIGVMGSIYCVYNGKHTTIYSLIRYDGEQPRDVIEAYLKVHPKIDTTRNLEHLRLRLTYENMMIAAVGGKASDIDMELGGIVRLKLRHTGYMKTMQDAIINKINRSPLTKQITSIQVMREKDSMTGDIEKWGELEDNQFVEAIFNIERSTDLGYRSPTELSKKYLKQFTDYRKLTKTTVAPLFNPDEATAEFLQQSINRSFGDDNKVQKMTSVQYSALSKGTNSSGKVVCFDKYGKMIFLARQHKKDIACRVRMCERSIVILKDKSMKVYAFEKEAVHEPA